MAGLLRLAAAAAGLAAGYAGERFVMDRERARPDAPDLDELTRPPDTVHHQLDCHDGGELHVVERGTGQPLVLLHGITLSYAVWHYQLRDLADRFRVVAVDQRGHGRSRPGEAGYGLHLLARDLVTTLDELDLHDAIVVGHSMGGMGLMRFCGDHPEILSERIAGLVFLSTTPLVPALSARFAPPALSEDALPVPPEWLPHYGFPSNDLSYVMSRMAFGKAPSPTHVEFTRAIISSMGPEDVRHSGMGLLLHDTTDVLEQVHVPSLVIVGTRDLITPLRWGRQLADRLPNSELVVLADCGHMPMLERRHQLAELLEKFAGQLP